MRVLSRCSGWRLCAPVVLGAVLAAAGCGDTSGIGKTVPVQGKVLWGGSPLTAGIVTYVPDEKAGNTSKFSPFGPIGSDGTYTLTTTTTTGSAKGAPPGKYKVTIAVNVPAMGTDAAAKPPAIDPAYTNAANTLLNVEVSESAPPGAYDLNLKK